MTMFPVHLILDLEVDFKVVWRYSGKNEFFLVMKNQGAAQVLLAK